MRTAWLIAAAWCGTLPAEAIQLDVTAEALCEVADLVVVAEVTTTETRWAEGDEGGLQTGYWVAVDRVLRGGPGDRSLEIVERGGSLGGFTHWVEHAPELHNDRRYLLMLVARDDGTWQVVGGNAGALPLRHANGAGRGVDATEAIETLGGCLDA